MFGLTLCMRQVFPMPFKMPDASRFIMQSILSTKPAVIIFLITGRLSIHKTQV